MKLSPDAEIICGEDYSMCCSSATPQLMFFLVDSSASMTKIIQGTSCMQRACDYVNEILCRLIMINLNGDRPKNRLFFSVASYDEDAKQLLFGFPSNYYDNPLRIDREKREVPLEDGGVTEVERPRPIWLDLSATHHAANMRAGIEYAKGMVSMWVKEHYETPAPIVLNITCDNAIIDDSLADSIQELKKIRTSDGEVLFFNLVVGAEEEHIFPVISDEEKETEHDLIHSSSFVPFNYQVRVREHEGPRVFDNNPFRVAYSTEVMPMMHLLEASYHLPIRP